VREQLDVIGRTNASIVEQQVEERTKKAMDRLNQAVEDGDTKAALAASKEIHDLAGKVNGNAPAGQAPSRESLTWAQKNESWFQKDPSATATAFEECNRLAQLGYSHADQLDAAEKRVRREHPHLFKTDGKPPPSVHSPTSRTPPPANRQKGFSDMPKAAQDVANDMAVRGVIKGADGNPAKPEDAKALYAKKYWENYGGKA
jgi:hypothetical protein